MACLSPHCWLPLAFVSYRHLWCGQLCAYESNGVDRFTLPYAKPPTGANRFADPLPPERFNVSLDTRALPQPCAQFDPATGAEIDNPLRPLDYPDLSVSTANTVGRHFVNDLLGLSDLASLRSASFDSIVQAQMQLSAEALGIAASLPDLSFAEPLNSRGRYPGDF
ncbi:hypothetical protein RHOSPDRAFT_37388 [Rhodotorula sp. JG-1b]|nr:hypothetical protein RHOSPDRAFT_37388 [Rhodotorula sp. JG-1b]